MFGIGPTSLPKMLAILSSKADSDGAFEGPPPVALWLAFMLTNFPLTLHFWSFQT